MSFTLYNWETKNDNSGRRRNQVGEPLSLLQFTTSRASSPHIREGILTWGHAGTLRGGSLRQLEVSGQNTSEEGTTQRGNFRHIRGVPESIQLSTDQCV